MLLKSEKLDESTIKFENIFRDKENLNIVKKIVKEVFFKKEKFSITEIKENMKKSQCIEKLVLSFGKLLDLVISKIKDLNFCNGVLCNLFSKYYKEIKKEYKPFFDSIFNHQKNNKINVFVCIISLMMYLNKKNHLLIFSILNNEEEIGIINKKYESIIKYKIFSLIVDYCKLFKIPIYYESLKDNKKEVTKDMVENNFKEVLFYNDIALKGKYKYYTNFCSNLYLSIIDDNTIKNIKFKNNTNINDYIEEIFQIIVSYFKEGNFFEDYNIQLMLEDIYRSAFIYASENFNNNYLDFVICYFDKYQIDKAKFFNLFLLGLKKNGFSKVFDRLILDEQNLIDVEDEKIMKNLIEKMLKKKSKKNNNNIQGSYDEDNINNVINKKEKEIGIEKEIEKDNVEKGIKKNAEIDNADKEIEKDIEKNNVDKIEPVKEIKKNEKELLKEKIDLEDDKVNNRDEEINDLKKRVKYLEEKISKLDKEKEQTERNNKIKINRLDYKVFSLNKKFDMISFRDLTRKVLDNMINYIKKKNNKFFNGLTKRKEKLEQISMFNFKEIEYMKVPIIEMIEKYYNSNSIANIPIVIQAYRNEIIRQKSSLIIEKVIDKYYNIMISSRNNNVFLFLKNELKIDEEIRSLYFKNNTYSS